MKSNTYFVLTSFLFGIISILHLLRALNQWPVMINSIVVPIWLSWAAFLLAGYLAVSAYKLGRKK